jgi:hypothetical protein
VETDYITTHFEHSIIKKHLKMHLHHQIRARIISPFAIQMANNAKLTLDFRMILHLLMMSMLL